MTMTNSNQEERGILSRENQSSGLFVRFQTLLGRILSEEKSKQITTTVVVVLLLAVVIFGMRAFYLNAQNPLGRFPVFAEESADNGTEEAQSADDDQPLEMPSFTISQPDYQHGIQRVALIHTSIPTRARVDVMTYKVKPGDSLFAIAEKFNLKPETILWGNFDVLADNPHTLQPGQELNILPVNGTYHEWREGESLRKVAEYYGVDPLDIIQWPGNHIDIYDFDMDNPDIEPGKMLIVPGGERELVDYGPPAITRDNPAIAATYGPGHCGAIYQGYVGVGVFIWPTTERWISGYDYNPGANHPAIDIAGSIGNPVWASDNGVVVYVGWSNYGYGNLVVIDHGNGWQTLYAHLNSYSVHCGQSVTMGQAIGALGSTGNSSGAHLHFEMIYQGTKVNPWNFLQ
jgi:murein DD-endopeptidase MepM/ murein hydrolase activator NlpD